MIPGGYILQPRIIKESEISHLSPCFREVWSLLLREAYHKEHNKLIRGQCYMKIDIIRESLHWYVGYRKETYSRRQVEGALEGLRKRSMIVSTKVIHGMIITICKYDYYQEKKNYERDSESDPNVPVEDLRNEREGANSNKNEKYEKNKENAKSIFPPTQQEVKDFFQSKGYEPIIGEKAWDFYNVNNWVDSKDNKVLNWKQKMIQVWFKTENKIKSNRLEKL
jgi:hypothetical protein